LVSPYCDNAQVSSPLRTSQALTNRRSILVAAHDLFIAQGFGAITIEQIASTAGVSKPTIFAAVGNKAAVFRAVRDIAMAGDDLRNPFPNAQVPTTLGMHRIYPAQCKHGGSIYPVFRRAAGIKEVLRGVAAN
jgi:hypothetical protein